MYRANILRGEGNIPTKATLSEAHAKDIASWLSSMIPYTIVVEVDMGGTEWKAIHAYHNKVHSVIK